MHRLRLVHLPQITDDCFLFIGNGKRTFPRGMPLLDGCWTLVCWWTDRWYCSHYWQTDIPNGMPAIDEWYHRLLKLLPPMPMVGVTRPFRSHIFGVLGLIWCIDRSLTTALAVAGRRGVVAVDMCVIVAADGHYWCSWWARNWCWFDSMLLLTWILICCFIVGVEAAGMN